MARSPIISTATGRTRREPDDKETSSIPRHSRARGQPGASGVSAALDPRSRGGDEKCAMTEIVDFPVKPETRDYLARFARDAGEPGWLAARRQQAMTRFAELGFPSRRGESWRYLDLQPLARTPLLPAHPAPSPDIAGLRERIAALGMAEAGARLVLVDGRFAPELSRLPEQSGVWLGAVSQAMRRRRDLAEIAAAEISGEAAQPFAALNAAFFADGYVLALDRGIRLEAPIEILHLASGASQASFHTRSLAVLGAGSSARIIESYAGDGRYWRNDVLAARLAEGATLHRAVAVEEAPAALHFGHLDALLEAGATFAGFALLLGGRRVRHEAGVRMAGAAGRCRLDGAFLVGGDDEANIVTRVDHAAPGGQTTELVKGVAADRGHGAFQGCVIVREGAQKTDASQQSRSLIIGRRAAIDTKPELEIYADDVRCAHGATVGDLDATALFYLRARGIPLEEARRMLIEGFLREAVEAIEDSATRTHLLDRLGRHLGKLEE
jgi:Fe-S cluster assembly protein SufD